jgi:hypothetical protein
LKPGTPESFSRRFASECGGKEPNVIRASAPFVSGFPIME